MLGWSTVFAILTICSPLTTLIEKSTAVPAVIASILFACLFVLTILIGAVRGRA